MGFEAGQSKGAAQLAAYYLQNGKGTHAYRYFGVHRLALSQGFTYAFRVCAPGADRVSLVGEWNGWQPIPMQRLAECGAWECTWHTDICPEGLRYKYRVQTGERVHDRADPYARRSESGGEGASVICTESHYIWRDSAYLARRAQKYADHEHYAYPMHVYEAEPRHWLSAEYAPSGDLPSYRAFADLLSQYAADMGYTHVLLRFPGRQNGGRGDMITRFAPDASLGTPDDFAYLVDRMHKQNIGVLLELECRYAGSHVSGLCDFDGCGLYAHAGHDAPLLQPEDPYASALLYSSALFWLREYHADGLYLNAQGMPCDRSWGTFVRTLASCVRKGMPDALLVLRAGGYRGLSAAQSLGGLGYDLIVDPRAERALLDCFSMSAELRVSRRAWKEAAHGLYAENTLVSLSGALSDSVMGSLSGSHAEKFATARLLYLFAACLPGKKLSFMGNELGQPTAATLPEGVAWFLRQIPSHAELCAYAKALNEYYLGTPALWERDFSKDGLCAVECVDAPDGVIAFKRFDGAGREVCVVLNMGAQTEQGIVLAVGGRYPYYACAFATHPMEAEMRFATGNSGCVTLDLAPLSGMILAPVIPAGGFWLEAQEKK